MIYYWWSGSQVANPLLVIVVVCQNKRTWDNMMNIFGGSLKKLRSSAGTTASAGGGGGSGSGGASTAIENGPAKPPTANGEVVSVNGPAEPVVKTELDELKEKATDVANESLMCTKRMTEYCEQAKDAGIKIIVALDDQKEQLDRIQDSLTQMRTDLIQAESNLRGMEKCCGIFNNPFKKSTFKEDETLWTDAGDGIVADGAPRRPVGPSQTLWPLNKGSSSHNSSSNSSNPGMASGYIPKITEDEMEEEMEKNMNLVSSMLGNLRNMAIDMNTEIQSQNKQMNTINDMTEQNNARIDDAIQRTHELKRQ